MKKRIDCPRKVAFAALIAASICLGACATAPHAGTTAVSMPGQPPTIIAQMRRDGATQRDMVKTWENGDREISAGEKRINNAARILERGNRDVDDGRAMIAEGRSRLDVQESAYRQATERIGAAKTPKLALDESRTLREIADTWQAALDQIEKGERLVSKGEEQLAEGRSLDREGDALLAQGRERIRQVELKYSGKEDPNAATKAELLKRPAADGLPGATAPDAWALTP